MADDIRRILFRFEGDSSDLRGEARKAESSMGGVTRSTGKTKGALAALAPVAKAAGVAAAAMAAKWAVDGIAMAAQAEMVGESFDKVFGDQADDLTQNMDGLRTAMGLSSAEFETLATRIGGINVNLGASSAEAAAFTEEMVVLAADIAAFNGNVGDAGQVLDNMESALTGSTEAMDKWGVNITMGQIKQKALNDTGKDSINQLTDMEIRLAGLALMQERATLQTDAMEDAMQSGATTQAELNARMKDMQLEVGGALAPLKEFALELIIKLLPVLEALVPILDVVVTLLDALMTLLDPLISLVGWLATKFGELVNWLIKGTGFLDRLKYGVETLRDAFWRLGNDIKRAWDRMNPFSGFRMPSFHSGGVVPGPRGSTQMAMLQGGETVVPAGSSRSAMAGGSSSSGVVINVTVNTGVGDPMEIGRQVADVLGEYSRQVGGIDLDVRA